MVKKRSASFDNNSKDITIKFASEEAAQHFKSWLCESGEQLYWEWMKTREEDIEEDDDPISVVEFDYFAGDGVIETKLGRLS